MKLHASMHIAPYVDPKQLQERIDLAVSAIQLYEATHETTVEAIAFRGMSGALIASPVAVRLQKSLILVRKPNDGSHSSYKVESCKVEPKNYVILDDFVSSGKTANAIIKAIKLVAPKAKYLGVLQVSYLHKNSFDGFRDGKKYEFHKENKKNYKWSHE